ncbi:MAG: hypothetical protein AAGG11_21190 [Pseudomonadota bacterium]
MDERPYDTRSFWSRLSGEGTATDRANTQLLNRWSLAWALLIVAAAWTLRYVAMPAPAQWAVALAPNLIALVVLQRYLRFLRMTDELLRRIHLEGLAVGFGTSYIFAIGYLIAQGAGAPPLNLTFFILAMTTAWLVGNITAMKRYR